MPRPGRVVRDEHTDRLFQALKTMETPDEFYAFFKDLCTTNEMIAMKQRFWVAELLEAGKTCHSTAADAEQCQHIFQDSFL